jgi:hypothetical protein
MSMRGEKSAGGWLRAASLACACAVIVTAGMSGCSDSKEKKQSGGHGGSESSSHEKSSHAKPRPASNETREAALT